MNAIETQNAFETLDRPSLATLAVVIARSQIVVEAAAIHRPLPADFDDVDIAILDWIAAEGRDIWM
jgi:hypothetical protein